MQDVPRSAYNRTARKCVGNITVHKTFQGHLLTKKTTIFNISRHPPDCSSTPDCHYIEPFPTPRIILVPLLFIRYSGVLGKSFPHFQASCRTSSAIFSKTFILFYNCFFYGCSISRYDQFLRGRSKNYLQIKIHNNNNNRRELITTVLQTLYLVLKRKPCFLLK